ncbi:hypothetical protein F8388_000202 [Cannabis sativa]|uniref:Uncharacterized protein n=1 Tax=Cannabis sativa TaxID=3483 RepID=A0A7J6F3J3_CANSA|nr:hypothetical protein F8388_000202 [Cannabis sativa]
MAESVPPLDQYIDGVATRRPTTHTESKAEILIEVPNVHSSKNGEHSLPLLRLSFRLRPYLKQVFFTLQSQSQLCMAQIDSRNSNIFQLIRSHQLVRFSVNSKKITMATYVGQVSVLSIIALFGAATPAIITTVRKAVTLLLSYVIFTKPMTNQHGAGLLLISMGIIVKMVPENQIPSWSSVLVTEAALISVQGKWLIE